MSNAQGPDISVKANASALRFDIEAKSLASRPRSEGRDRDQCYEAEAKHFGLDVSLASNLCLYHLCYFNSSLNCKYICQSVHHPDVSEIYL